MTKHGRRILGQRRQTLVRSLRQCAGLQGQNAIYTSQRSQRNSLSQIPAHELTRDVYVNVQPDNGRKEATDELLDAEASLSRAKEEYCRLQQELATSAERIKALNLENEVLSENQRELTNIQKECEEPRFKQNELDTLRSDNRRYLEKGFYGLLSLQSVLP